MEILYTGMAAEHNKELRWSLKMEQLKLSMESIRWACDHTHTQTEQETRSDSLQPTA